MKTKITFILALAAIVVLSAGMAWAQTTHYVNTGGVCSGTPCYTTIQAAISAALDGDTILVDPGSYDENLDIDVKVSIEGAGSGTNPSEDTIIDPSGGSYGMYIHQPVNLKDLRVTGAPNHGIRVEPSNGPLAFSDVTWENIASSNNGANGVELHNWTSVSNMEIIDSEFVGNTKIGIRASSATPIDGLLITNSHLDGNTYGGYLAGGCSNITVNYTTMNNNSVRGWYGCEIGKITNIKFENCEANDNGLRGITVFTYDDDGIDGVEIRNTEIKNNLQRGFHIGAAGDPPGGWDEDVPSPIKNVLIENCSILDNGLGGGDAAGFHVDIGDLTNVKVRCSNISGNMDYGVYNADTYSAGEDVDARYNWWGCADGPGALGCDTVSDNVDYDPWIDTQVGDICPPPWFVFNHFTCYDVKEVPPKFEKLVVFVKDQFMEDEESVEVKKPKLICIPCTKDGFEIKNPDFILKLYQIKKPKEAPKFEPRDVLVTDQFGEETLTVKKPKYLAVPALKEEIIE